MNVVAMINDLRHELERIDGLILALESFRSGRRRGRPPKALQALRAQADMGSSPVAQRAAAALKDAPAPSAGKSKKRPGRPAAKKASKPKP
jgi:hypothetical protein